MTNQRIGVVIVDDHDLMIDGLSAFIEQEDDIELVGTATKSKTLFEGLNTWQEPDVIVLDINLNEENINGIGIAERLRKDYPTIKVLALSVHTEGRFIYAMLAKGCVGYLFKDSRKEEFLTAIRAAALGKKYMPPKVTEVMLNHLDDRPRKEEDLPKLTKREREVLEHLITGESTREIAAHLGISEHTIETHKRNMIEKYHARNTTDLVRIVMQHDIMEQ